MCSIYFPLFYQNNCFSPSFLFSFSFPPLHFGISEKLWKNYSSLLFFQKLQYLFYLKFYNVYFKTGGLGPNGNIFINFDLRYLIRKTNMPKKCQIFANRLATCKNKYAASALISKKLNSSKGEKYEAKVVGNGSFFLKQTNRNSTLCACLHVCMYIVSLSACVSVCLSVCLFVCLFVCLSVKKSFPISFIFTIFNFLVFIMES